jgi:hypothetical protein
VTFTAAVAAVAPGSGTPTGNVRFRVDGANLGTPVALVNGVATSIAATTMAVGGRAVTADYLGATNYTASTGTLAGDQVVNQAATTTAVSASQNPSVFGESVTFTVTVAPVAPGSGTPSGTVQFKVDGVNLGGLQTLASGSATSPATTTLAVGTRVITAEYGGVPDFVASTGTLAGGQVVNQAATTTGVTSSDNPSVFGQSVTFTAAVVAEAPGSGTPSGTVQFKVDGVNLGGLQTLASGSATSPATTTLAVGTRVITAEYGGAPDFVASTGTLAGDQVVNQAATTTGVTSSDNPSVFGQSVTFTATVVAEAPGSGTPSGTVQFKVDGVTLEAPVALDGAGQAQLNVDTLAVGTYGITAEYTGSTNFVASTGTLSPDQTVDPAATATTVMSDLSAATVVGEAYTVAVTVVAVAPGTGTPGGSVTVSDGAETCSAPLTAGAGSCALTSTTAGPKSVTGTYVATTDYLTSTSVGVPHTVNPAVTTTTVGSSLNPSVFGQSVTFTATVAAEAPGNGMPSGTAQFKVDGVNLEAPVALDGAGQAQLSVDTLSAGTYGITAEYGGVTDFTASTGTLSPDQTVTSTAAAVTKTAGDNLVGLVATPVNTAPRVRVDNELGNPMAGVPVTFTVTGGGGTVESAPSAVVVTDVDGLAAVGDWTLGASVGATNTVQATVGALVPETFTATGEAAAFDIVVRLYGDTTTFTPGARTAFDAAETRWESLVFGDLSATVVNVAAGAVPCDATLPAVNETVDDVLIFAKIEPIDGVGGILGSAGPCLIRASGPNAPLTVLGRMRFDSDDVATLESNGTLNLVVQHEMGHVLGYGTLWNQSPLSLRSGTGGADPFFTGSQANDAFDRVGGTAYVAGPSVPVENTGGAGTRDAHWREGVFDNELMTGFLAPGANPMSIVSLGSLWDMSYLVNYAAADAYSWPSPPALREGPVIEMIGDIDRLPIVAIDASGRVIETIGN